jgi:hypothetical protein
MRGDDQQLQSGMFSYVALEDRIPADHPLRGVRKLVDAVLAEMSKDFEGLYSKVGTTLDSAGAVTASLAAAGFLFGEERTAADAATELQLAISLVCEPSSRRTAARRSRPVRSLAAFRVARGKLSRYRRAAKPDQNRCDAVRAPSAQHQWGCPQQSRHAEVVVWKVNSLRRLEPTS